MRVTTYDIMISLGWVWRAPVDAYRARWYRRGTTVTQMEAFPIAGRVEMARIVVRGMLP